MKVLTITKAKLSECLRASGVIENFEEVDNVVYSPNQDCLHLTINKVFENIWEKQ